MKKFVFFVALMIATIGLYSMPTKRLPFRPIPEITEKMSALRKQADASTFLSPERARAAQQIVVGYRRYLVALGTNIIGVGVMWEQYAGYTSNKIFIVAGAPMPGTQCDIVGIDRNVDDVYEEVWAFSPEIPENKSLEVPTSAIVQVGVFALENTVALPTNEVPVAMAIIRAALTNDFIPDSFSSRVYSVPIRTE